MEVMYMPLKSKREYGKGILINQIETNNKKEEIPFNIYIYQLPEIVVKSNTTMGEYYMRQQLKGLMNPFNADYYVDKLSAWCALPAYHKVLIIGICGFDEKVYNNLIKLLIHLAKKYEISIDRIFFKFNNDELIEKFKNEAYNNNIEEVHFEIETQENKILPICNYLVMINNQWQEPDYIRPITGLKVFVNIGELTYRVHYYQRNWSNWVKNNEEVFSNNSYIDGIQLNYQSEEYKLEYEALIEDRGTTGWRDKTLSTPYNRAIKGIDFRLVNKEVIN